MDAGGGVLTFPFPDPPPAGRVLEVAPGVLWLRLPLPMKLNHVNVFLLDDAEGWTIVDTGMHSRRMETVWAEVLAGPLAGKPVARIVLTHHHPDHVGMAGWLTRETGAKIWATRTAWLFARMLTLDEHPRPTAEAMAFYTAAGMAPDLLEARRAARPMNFCDSVYPIPLGFHRLQEGMEIAIGGRLWRVHIGHGHAPEHATLWADDVVLVGDQILPGISSNLGVYPTEPEADTVGDWLESCLRLQAHAQPGQLALPGHNTPFRGIATRLDQLIDNHHTALTRLLDALRVPRTAAECFEPLYRRRIGSGEYGLALAEAVGHLNHLHQAGKIARTRREDGAWLWSRN